MKPLKLRVLSDQGVEATISTDGSQGGVDDYYSIIAINGFLEDKKVYGIDPIQSFSLGLKLIEQLTEDKRIGVEGEDPMPGITWRIEIVED